MGISKVTRNCQITIPKDVRMQLNVKEGDEVIFTVIDKKVLLNKSTKDIIGETAGIWKSMKETGVEYENRMRKGWSKRLAREYATR
jgi:AbrB family looped-hinge helix DNA binding protein